MEDATKGLVILILTIGGGAAIWIGILYWRLSVWKKEVVEIRTERDTLRRKLEDREAVETAAGRSDNELAADVGAMLDDL